MIQGLELHIGRVTIYAEKVEVSREGIGFSRRGV